MTFLSLYILKKGDPISCDNWQGISLLDIVETIVARMLQDRLQKIAEDDLTKYHGVTSERTEVVQI